MKKKTAVLALVACVSVLTACDTQTNTSQPEQSVEQSTTQSVEQSTVQSAEESTTQSSTESSSVPASSETVSTAESTSTSDESESSAPAEKSEYVFEVKGASLAKDYAGKDVLVIDYSFTNNSADEKSFTLACSDKVYQDGIECGDVVVCDDIDAQEQLNNVLPGNTYELKVGYIVDISKPVNLRVESLFGDKVYINKNITITDGNVEITEAENNAGGVQEGAEKYAVEITGAKLGKDYESENILIVNYKFTNNSGEAKAFAYTLSAKVYQNGVECGDIVVSDEVDTQTTLNEVMSGNSYEVQEGYKVDITKPVDIKVTSLFGDEVYLEKTAMITNGNVEIS